MKHKKILLTSVLGNTLEYYEFSIFAVFALQIGKAFFPSYDEIAQILLTFAVFGVGFVGRPFGSMFFGHIGDKFGRKIALLITITGMSCATFGIGLMPNYASIGLMSTVILVALRLMQGVFIAGEGSGSAVYVLEHEMRLTKNVISGLLVTSNIAGIIIASIVGITIERTVGLDSESWRLAFLFGGALGLVISFLRLTMPESARFDQIKIEEKPIIPIVLLFSKYWRQVLTVMFYCGFSAAFSYIIKGYLTVHFQKFMNLSKELSLFLLMYTCVVFAIMAPVFGHVLRKISHRTLILGATVLLILVFAPLFHVISISGDNMAVLVLALTAIGSMGALLLFPSYLYISEMFPTEVRYTGLAVSSNLGVTLMAGFTPAISTYLVTETHMLYAPAVYVTILAFVFLLVERLLHARIYSAK